MTKVRAHIIIGGAVQGVFFRAHTREIALNHSVHGWVQNRMDGAVEAVFEGDETAVKKVIDWCRHGPPAARVHDVIVNYLNYTGEFNGFIIKM
ncbi:MAG: acylphosphatase [Deltaproteobacteria bacterium GWC2_42_11]|nr:MAG: acylphosphatase [Deltaproteobacteria bacterium GWC2_42_11]HBO84077.1 acylphosphatase [Deltaproteobacteria bacterium]